ncbi:MAG: uracil-DNA glycosylase [Hydrotalea sp.]|nr:uracil-DNA glycosylase [Hydrotalea sp.]
MANNKSSGGKSPTATGANIADLVASLEWQIAMGADEAHAAQPIDRFKEKLRGDGFNEKSAANKTMVSDGANPAVAASRTKLESEARAKEDLSHDTSEETPEEIPLGSFAALAQATAMADKCKTLDDIIATLAQYEGCPLKHLARQMVFGAGVARQPILMVIGDAPDETEDREGQPFVGRPAQLIKKALAAAGFASDKNVYFTNSVYWKRPGSRAANAGEQKSCLPFLLKQIEIINPQQIWVMGIGGALSFFDMTVAKCRAQKKSQLKIHVKNNERAIPVMVSHSPDYYWQRPLEKKSLWQDILAIKASVTVV